MIADLFRRRVRGFRVIELGAFALVVVLAFGVYLAKTQAGREWAKISVKERQIAQEKRKIKLLRAEVAHLEQPERLEQLAGMHLNLQAVDGTKEARPETLRDIVDPAEKRVVVAAPAAPVAPPAEEPSPMVEPGAQPAPEAPR
ncbi:MAG TPA: cell division protein [Caulobacteraceae bacterium]|jgi:cell division protein FtsL